MKRFSMYIGLSCSLFLCGYSSSESCHSLASGHAGSPSVVQVRPGLSGFHSLSVSHSCKARLDKQKKHSVQVTINANLRRFLVVQKRGSSLHIGLKSGFSYRDVRCEAKVSMPSLRAVELTGASQVTSGDFGKLGRVELRMSGATHLRLKAQFQALVLRASGASVLRLSGQAGQADLVASGACKLSLAKLTTQRARLQLSGASRARLHVKARLDARLSGASHLSYKGQPKGTRRTSGISRIESTR